MPSLKQRRVEDGLAAKGFRRDDGDHRWWRLHVDGRATSIRTKTSHGRSGDALGDALVATIARQLRLRVADLVDLVECPLTHDQYVARLVADGHVRLD